MAEDGAGDGGGGERRGSPEAAKLLKAAARGDASAVVAIFDALDPERAVGGAGALRARGTTALHEAAKGGHTIIVEELLRRRTEVDVLNKSGCTSLHFAVLCKEKQKALDVATCLLEARSSANTESERLDTPLHFASYCEGKALSEDVVRLLLDHRAQVNRLNRSSESPLMNAVLNSNLESARVLLEARADATQKSALGKTAADIATDRNSEALLELLVAAARLREEGEQASAGDVALVRGVSRQMGEARALATAAERLRGEVLRRTGHAHAYESAAAVVLAGLGAPARAAVADRSVDAVRCIQAEAGGSEDACGRPVPLEPLFQALATMALVARCDDGATVLVAAGLAEILPFVEAQVGELQAGEHEVLELRAALGRASRRQSEHRSRTGTPEAAGALEEPPAPPAGPGPARAPKSPAPKRPSRPPGPQVLTAWGSSRPAGPKGDPGPGKADAKADAKAGYPVT